jgi:hypothetical protein
MSSDVVLHYVGATHAAVLAAVSLVLWAFGWPIKGALLGGGLIAFSFVTFWVVARSITEPGRKPLAIVLGCLKVLLYLALSAAVLSGKLVADGEGFALGVSCFVLATLLVALATMAHGPPQLAKGPEA